MKFSELWLREWINPPVSITELANKITMSGLKVNFLESVSGCFDGVVIGNIIDIKRHPNHYHLWIYSVDIGNQNLLSIICKEKQFQKNSKVVVAPQGAILPNNRIIQNMIINGKLSEGILCSFKSLGIIYENIYGVIELPKDAPVGQDIKKYLHLNDNIIDITITPNRSDCLSVMGIAHEIAAIYRLSLIQPTINYIQPEIDDIKSIIIEVPNICPCYLGRILTDIDLSVPTPLWMKEKMRRSGIQPINTIMDITNYVLLELGQPIHIFDLDKIYGEIYIRFSNQGEKLNSFNDTEIILTENTVIIADQKNPLAIAGILVGSFASVNEQTSNIILGTAFLDPSFIMMCAKKYKLHTQSSYHYARGVNQDLIRLALERVTFFLMKICGGKPGIVINVTNINMLPKPAFITLHRNKLDKILGYIIKNNDIRDILICIGCAIEDNIDNDIWRIHVPIWRFDLSIEEDIIEEIIRLYGYDKIIGIPICTNLKCLTQNKNILSLSRIKTLLMDLGYQEIISYSFVDPKTQKLLYPNYNPIKLLNPLTQEMAVMRLTLWVGLIKTLIYNQNRQQKRIRLFESGQCFSFDQKNTLNICQNLMLSGIITGSRFDEHWDIVSNESDFYDIKGDVEAILTISEKLHDIKFKPKLYPGLHPGQAAAIYLKEKYIGCLGAIHPILEKKLNLQMHTFVFELFWDKIAFNDKKETIYNIPKFPISRRDISIIIPEYISSGAILSVCKKTIKNHLIDIKLFDVYRGKGISNGFKSLSIGLYIYHVSRTLQEAEIETIVKKCIMTLQKKFQIHIRN